MHLEYVLKLWKETLFYANHNLGNILEYLQVSNSDFKLLYIINHATVNKDVIN